MESKITAIANELAKGDALKNQIPTQVGIYSLQTANDTIMEMINQPDPKQLWRSFWYEWELCILFSDTNKGKSVLAVQIADEIAKLQKVLYFDFELSKKQFQMRYTNEEKRTHIFSNNLIRVELGSQDGLDDDAFEQLILGGLEDVVNSTGAKVLIIDNVTYLTSDATKGNLASLLMKKLKDLKKKLGLSILVIGHTPKISEYSPLCINNLAGSKMLSNYADSMFAVGQSAKDKSMRYVKQLKCRAGEYEYDAENVLVCNIIKTASFLHFDVLGTGTESEHLKQRTDEEIAAEVAEAKALKQQGLSSRQIAAKMGISDSRAYRLLKK